MFLFSVYAIAVGGVLVFTAGAHQFKLETKRSTEMTVRIALMLGGILLVIVGAGGAQGCGG